MRLFLFVVICPLRPGPRTCPRLENECAKTVLRQSHRNMAPLCRHDFLFRVSAGHGQHTRPTHQRATWGCAPNRATPPCMKRIASAGHHGTVILAVGAVVWHCLFSREIWRRVCRGCQSVTMVGARRRLRAKWPPTLRQRVVGECARQALDRRRAEMSGRIWAGPISHGDLQV